MPKKYREILTTEERLRRLKEVDLEGLKPMVKSIYTKQIKQCKKEIKEIKERIKCQRKLK